ncbi:protocadherin Fat 4 [Agrilus planipennis]|uniref:Protocadherin Fat 4 n=1 Tax=Agrilus planipennis TaxID=224129 RepID=A0A1W4WGP4_AGRPL|nr:protocadherin Fat 4 [Agrilus planipennis]XP_018319633.1 protocadherin Fat 4 [Agrilus planipennis]
MDLWCRNTNTYIIFFLILQVQQMNLQELLDNRCFLENGSTRENIIIPENSPVGSIIGQLNIVGNPGPGGDIVLHLEESKGPVTIIPGSKNFTLKHQLDKEGIDGPSSVFLNVICERVHTFGSGFVIPVTIRVTDVNDNYPIFVKAPYKLNISEVTVVGTRVLRGVHAIDADQSPQFSTVLYSVLPGPYSDFFEFENQMEGTLVLKRPLDYEKLKKFDVKIRAMDSGEPPKYSDTILTVNVLDADDQNPKFNHEKYSSSVPETIANTGTQLKILPSEIKAYDQDVGINATIVYDFISDDNDYKHFNIDKLSARVKVKKSLDLNGDPVYPKTLVVRATQHDNPDRYALTTLTVSRPFLEGRVSFLKRSFEIVVPESTPRCTVIGVLATNRPGEDLKYYVSNKDILETFAINPRGEVALRKSLDYEKTDEYFFKVFATDGKTNDSASVNITVKDVNEWEPRFRYPIYEFFVTEKFVDSIGKIEVKDGDINDKLSLSLNGSNASLFYITPNGELKLKDPLVNLKGVVTLLVTAKDDADPPHEASVPVTVYFHVKKSSEIIEQKDTTWGSSTMLAGLGTLLLLLGFVIFILICYIMKSKRKSHQEGLLPSARSHTSGKTNTKSMPNIINAFEEVPKAHCSKSDERGASSDRRKPSPKVHPAPQPPFWSSRNPVASPNKRLNWEDKKVSNSLLIILLRVILSLKS